MKVVNQKSFAGKLGAASRWKNHVKISTTLIRVNKNDAAFLTDLASCYGISVGVLVSRIIQLLRADKVAIVST